jgi:light-regulated signal transduction histidine kinase (bacteriophytochrome)
MFERSREEVIGHTVHELNVWVDLGHREALFAELRRHGVVHNYEMNLRKKSGRVMQLSWSGVRLEVDGEPCLLGSALDITERKRSEEEIRRLNASLEERVQERTRQLAAANQELEAFSYSVSHDLRAPLRAVDGFSQAVLEDYAGHLPAEGRRQLQTVRESAQRMAELIDDLLAFAKLGKQAMRREPVNMDQLVRSALADLQTQHTGRQIEFRVGALPPGVGDPALLKQVWMNLLSNAVKYTRGRLVAVVDISCNSDAGEPVYSVHDNGAGFDMQYVHKLFGVFQRLHRAEEYEGTGVGLAIVQRIVHRHGGRVWAAGAVDQGATFFFTINPASLP